MKNNYRNVMHTHKPTEIEAQYSFGCHKIINVWHCCIGESEAKQSEATRQNSINSNKLKLSWKKEKIKKKTSSK